MILRLVMRAVGTRDERSPDQIRAEAREELGHHVDCLRDELIRGGAAVDELDARVAERFGDAERYAAECTRIALKERVMLQRINLGLLIVLGVAVAWSAWGTAQASARSAAALDKMMQQIDALSMSRRPAPGTLAPGDVNRGVVVVKGTKTVGRPGLFALTDNPLTVRRVLDAAGFSEDHWQSDTPIRVVRLTKENSNEVVFSLSRAEFAKPDGKDFVLAAGDVIEAP